MSDIVIHIEDNNTITLVNTESPQILVSTDTANKILEVSSTTLSNTMIPGEPGSSGTSGTSGESGSSGEPGSSGTSGTSGENGSSGSSGTSGESGSSGTSGNDGISGGAVYFLNLSETQSPYYEFSTTPTNDIEQSITKNVGFSSTISIAEFMTPNGVPGVTHLPQGIWKFFIHASAESDNNIEIFVEVHKRNEIGVETLLFTTDPEIITSITPVPIMFVTDVFQSGYSLDLTDRLVIKIFATNNSSINSFDTTIYTEGITHYSYGQTTLGIIASSSGTSGTSGQIGEPGSSGSSGTSGESGLPGESGSSGSSGTSGESGLPGESGSSGSSGTSGQMGSPGPSGSSGSSGTSGQMGEPGSSGSSGTSGIDGINGSSGSSGTSGIDGINGSSGSSGISGTNGSSGTSGTNGTSGTSGTTGSSGTSGTPGSSGSSGTSGQMGSPGPSGSSGSSGTSGTAGTSGTPGSSGTSGTAGTSGTPGSSGTSGTAGTSGTPGSSGTSGISFTGQLTLSQGPNIVSSGVNIDNYSLSSDSLFLVTGTGGINLTGFANGSVGRFVVITNTTGGNITFQQENTNSSASNRFILGVSNKTINVNQTVTFVYVSGLTVAGVANSARWILTATT
jgi:hypothetical protein